MDCAVKTPGTFLEIVTRFVNAMEVLFMDVDALRRFKEEVFFNISFEKGRFDFYQVTSRLRASLIAEDTLRQDLCATKSKAHCSG